MKTTTNLLSIVIILFINGCAGHSERVIGFNEKQLEASTLLKSEIIFKYFAGKAADSDIELAKLKLEILKLQSQQKKRKEAGRSLSLNRAEGGSDGQPCEDLCQIDACGQECLEQCPEEYESLCIEAAEDAQEGLNTAGPASAHPSEEGALSVSDNSANGGSVVVSVTGNSDGNTFTIGGAPVGTDGKLKGDPETGDPIERALAEVLRREMAYPAVPSDFETNSRALTDAFKGTVAPLAWPFAAAYMANQAAGVAETGIRHAGGNISAHGATGASFNDGAGASVASPDLSTNVDDHSVTGGAEEAVE